MKKLDLRKELKPLYLPSAREVEVVEVPAFQFVMLDGRLEPGTSPGTSAGFREAMLAVYSVSFALKFMSKLRARNPIDYGVTALEGLWWADAGEFDLSRKEAWCYTLMMLQPDHITPAMVRKALEQLGQKRPNPALDQMRFERFREGLCAQIMHVGPYADELRTIEKLHVFAREHGYVLRGKHHEIYLGDPRRARPERLKTVLRHPIARGA